MDGNFLRESARYLGYEAGRKRDWKPRGQHQEGNGGFFAGRRACPLEGHRIAMFSLVRQAELSQDWSYFRSMQPQGGAGGKVSPKAGARSPDRWQR